MVGQCDSVFSPARARTSDRHKLPLTAGLRFLRVNHGQRLEPCRSVRLIITPTHCIDRQAIEDHREETMRRQIVLALVLLAGFNLVLGCAGTQGPTPESAAPGSIKLLADYPDHTFNPKAYIQGMEAAGHHLYLWQDQSVDLSSYDTFTFNQFSTRHLPKLTKEQRSVFSYKTFAKKASYTFEQSLEVSDSAGPSTLILKGALVECDPGSRAARFLVGFGAGKSAGAIACEVYKPGAKEPIMRIYARDTGSMGAFGGDSVAMLSHIFEQVSLRVSSALETRVGG